VCQLDFKNNYTIATWGMFVKFLVPEDIRKFYRRIKNKAGKEGVRKI
jgi:hypothetical protein